MAEPHMTFSCHLDEPTYRAMYNYYNREKLRDPTITWNKVFKKFLDRDVKPY